MSLHARRKIKENLNRWILKTSLEVYGKGKSQISYAEK
jgi:hypothetical protein